MLDAQVWSFSSHHDKAGLALTPIKLSPAVAQRILVDASIQDCLGDLLVAQERTFDTDRLTYSVPAEVDQLIPEAGVDGNFSDIFENTPLPEYGRAENRKPRCSAGHQTSLSLGLVAQQPRIISSEYMKASQQSELHAWSASVEQSANPEDLAIVPIDLFKEAVGNDESAVARSAEIDGEDASAPQLTKRQVAVDSDEESEGSDDVKTQLVPKRPLSLNPGSKSVSHQRYKPLPEPEHSSQLHVTSESRLLDFEPDVSEFTPPVESVSNDPRRWDLVNRSVTDHRGSTTERSSGISERGNEEGVSQLLTLGSERAPYSIFESSGEAHRGGLDIATSHLGNRNIAATADLQANTRYSSQSGVVEDVSSDAGWQEAPSKQRGSRGRRPTQQSASQLRSARTDSISAWRSPPSRSSHNQISDRCGILARPPQALIDIQEASQQSGRAKPPPGLDIRTTSHRYTTTSDHLLDLPLEDIQRPSLKPQYDGPLYESEENSHSTRASSSSHGAIFEYTPQTQISKPDVNFMRNQALVQLAGRAQERSLRNSEQTERIHQEEGPRFYNSMNLRARNKPRKPSSSVQSSGTQETAAEKAARIRKVKDDIYGHSSSTESAETLPPGPRAREEQLSRTAQRVARTNPLMAATHAVALQENTLRDQAREIHEKLRPSLEAAQSFAGELTFELQLGRLLITPFAAHKSGRIYTRQKLSEIFLNAPESPAVHFTNQLTSNGVDIDRLVQVRANGQLWDHEVADSVTNLLEFHCQAESHEFILVLDLDKQSHCLQRGPSTISKIGVQCTAMIWDICAVLEGHSIWHDAPDEVSEIIKVFIDTLYVKPGRSCRVYYRPPQHNNLLIHSVVSRCAIVYNSKQQPGTQLRVAEVKRLYTAVHTGDQRLHSSYELPWSQMAEDAQIYYQVSIVQQDLVKAFAANRDLELGQSTSASSALTVDLIYSMLSTAMGQVGKMDFVGSATCGTLIRTIVAQQNLQSDLRSRLPPSTSARYSGYPDPIVPVPLSVVDTHRGTATGSKLAPPLGIRAHTTAQLWRNEVTRELFWKGINGANIPVSSEEAGPSSREVLPDDSASQVGVARRQARSNAFVDEKGEGFW